MEDPKFGKGLVAGFCGMSLGFEGGVDFALNVFDCLVDFIANFPVPMHYFDVESNVATYWI